MAEQCLKLLSWGYEKYLNVSFTLDDVTIGESCGSEKYSFHVMIYNGTHVWDTGKANRPPYNSSQHYFMKLLREETLRDPVLWDCLTFVGTTGIINSVIDLTPYNSKGNQALRTLMSSKRGSSRILKPYDGYFQPLPLEPKTIVRGFASIEKHPNRTHSHTSYWILQE